MTNIMTLADLFQTVQLQYNALNRAFDSARTAEQMNALLRELREFTHRLDLIQSLRVSQSTADLSGLAGDLGRSHLALTRALDGVRGLNDWVRACSAFLGVVDAIIDLAKLA